MSKSKKTKKKIKASLKLPSSTPPVNGYTIIPSTGTDGEKAMRTRFHGAVSLLTADCVD